MHLFTPSSQQPGRSRPALFTPATGAAAGSNSSQYGQFAGGAVIRPFEVVDHSAMNAVSAEPPPPELEPTAGLMNAFAVALREWSLTHGTSVAEHLPLLAKYEAICDRAIALLEAQLQQPSCSPTRAASLASECALLRGERSSWRLLRLLYADYDTRQQPPPEPPPYPADWGVELRALGPAPPKLGREEVAARLEDDLPPIDLAVAAQPPAA